MVSLIYLTAIVTSAVVPHSIPASMDAVVRATLGPASEAAIVVV